MSEVTAVVPVVSIINNQIVTTSLNVAEVFEKQHKDVLKAIRNLGIPDDFRERNFAPNKIKVLNNPSGEEISHYHLTRDGFTILAFGFTGKKAMKFKLAYIDAFNRMEAELTKRGAIPQGQPAPCSIPAAKPAPGFKRCSRCGEVRPVDEFFRNISRPDGLQHYCKFCTKKIAQEYAEKNRRKNLQAVQAQDSNQLVAPEKGRDDVDPYVLKMMDLTRKIMESNNQFRAQLPFTLMNMVQSIEADALVINQIRNGWKDIRTCIEAMTKGR